MENDSQTLGEVSRKVIRISKRSQSVSRIIGDVYRWSEYVYHSFGDDLLRAGEYNEGAMAGQYYPKDDHKFEAWVANFNTNLPAMLAGLGFPPTFDDDLLLKHAAYAASLQTHVAAQAAARAARQEKDADERALIDAVRAAVRQLRANPSFDDAMAVSLGLPIYDKKPTPKRAGTEIPTLKVEIAGPQTHAISFWQMTEEHQEKASRPAWARAMKILRSVVEVGEPCPPIELMGYLASDTAPPYVVMYGHEAVGKDAYYRGAWETPRGEIGPWSPAVRATIAG